MQEVPAGIAITTDHAPDAQRWKEVPPRQFHMPSVLQGPVKVPVVEPENEEAGDGAALGAETDASTEVAREEAVFAAAAGVVAATEATVVGVELFPPRIPAARPPVGAAAGAVLRLEDTIPGVTAGAELAGAAAAVELEEAWPVAPRGKQFVPTGFA